MDRGYESCSICPEPRGAKDGLLCNESSRITRRFSYAGRCMLVIIGWSTYAVNGSNFKRKSGWSSSGTSVSEVAFGRITTTVLRIGIECDVRVRIPRDIIFVGQGFGALNTTATITHSRDSSNLGESTRRNQCYFPETAQAAFIDNIVARFF